MPADYPPTNNEARMKKVPFYVDLCIGVGAAVVASGCVTPFVLTIDKAVVQAAAGSIKLGPALVSGVVDLMKKPGKMLMSVPLWLVWGVYASTYIAANSIDVYNERKALAANNAAMVKLGGVTAVNMSASLVKDVTFAKLFGAKDIGKEAGKAASNVAKRVPLATYGIFLSRDTLTIAGGFTVPPIMSSLMQSTLGYEKKNADKLAQLVSPMAMQLICTPLHLLALNMYNVEKATAAERAA